MPRVLRVNEQEMRALEYRPSCLSSFKTRNLEKELLICSGLST